MKFRHAGSLALVGWYLILPPASLPSAPLDWRSTPKLNTWARVAYYDSAADCNNAKMALINTMPKESADVLRAMNAECIAIDDRRL